MGVPQGGPLSPVLANVVLDELDGELERRGHRFARIASDCNILVKSKRAGERVMASVSRFLSDTLRLTVNPLKSAVDHPAKRTFLGFTVSRNDARLKVADKAIDKRKRAHPQTDPSYTRPPFDRYRDAASRNPAWLGRFLLLQNLHFRHPWRSKRTSALPKC